MVGVNSKARRYKMILVPVLGGQVGFGILGLDHSLGEPWIDQEPNDQNGRKDHEGKAEVIHPIGYERSHQHTHAKARAGAEQDPEDRACSVFGGNLCGDDLKGGRPKTELCNGVEDPDRHDNRVALIEADHQIGEGGTAQTDADQG